MLLLVIRRWLEKFPYHDCSDMPRNEIVAWIKKEFPTVGDVELMADGLIAAGIGREEEQWGTVVVHVSYTG